MADGPPAVISSSVHLFVDMSRVCWSGDDICEKKWAKFGGEVKSTDPVLRVKRGRSVLGAIFFCKTV